MAEDMQAVIDAARLGCEPQIMLEGVLWLPASDNGQGRVLDVDQYQARPRRKRGSVVVFDAASFNQVLADNVDAGNCAIYFDRNPEAPAVVGVLNGHGKGGTGWGDFRVSIEFRPTPQWVRWKAIDGKMLTQVQFAEFIEDNLEDIAEPAGAVMLEIATQLQVVRSVNFKSKVTLSSGAFTFQHDQSDQASVGAGSIEVPATFTLGIAPIFGLPPYQVPARFRYRILEGRLSLGFKLQRVETMMSRIVEDVVAKIERGANISVLDGLPPKA